MNFLLSEVDENNVISGVLTLKDSDLKDLLDQEIMEYERSNQTRRIDILNRLYHAFKLDRSNKSLRKFLDFIQISLNNEILKGLETEEGRPFCTKLRSVEKIGEKDSQYYKVEFFTWLEPTFEIPDLNLLLIDPAVARQNPNQAVVEAYLYLFNNSVFLIPDFVIDAYEFLFSELGRSKLMTDPLIIDTGLFAGYNAPIKEGEKNPLREAAIRYVKTICIVENFARQYGLKKDMKKIQDYSRNVLEISKIKLRNSNLILEDLLYFPDSVEMTVLLEEELNHVLNYVLKHS